MGLRDKHFQKCIEFGKGVHLSTLSSDTPGKLNILGHDGDTLRVNGAEVGVLEEANQISFSGLLQSTDSGTLEPQVGLEVLGNFTNQALEGKLAYQEIGGLLELADLAKRNGTRAVAMGFLDSSRLRSGLATYEEIRIEREQANIQRGHLRSEDQIFVFEQKKFL